MHGLAKGNPLGALIDPVLDFGSCHLSLNVNRKTPSFGKAGTVVTLGVSLPGAAALRGQEETPSRFERLCYRALAEDLISLPKAAELLQKHTNEIEVALNGPGRNNASCD